MFIILSSTIAWLSIAQISVRAAPTTLNTLEPSLKIRGACDPYPPGGGPPVHSPNDTAESFYAYQPFQYAAMYAPIPYGWSPVNGFRNLRASAQAEAYMGLNGSLTSYDPYQCANQCQNMDGCESFNIFFERDPTVDANDSLCPDPPSLTRIKCTFFGVPLYSQNATNTGQYQSKFHVVIAGSDAYNNIYRVSKGPAGPAALLGAPDPSKDILFGVPTFPLWYKGN